MKKKILQMIIIYNEPKNFQGHQWCSGNIKAFQAFALGSIPGWCIFIAPLPLLCLLLFYPFFSFPFCSHFYHLIYHSLLFIFKYLPIYHTTTPLIFINPHHQSHCVLKNYTSLLNKHMSIINYDNHNNTTKHWKLSSKHIYNFEEYLCV